MPLSEQEQRLLEEMERSLYHNDADFVATVSTGRGKINYTVLMGGVLLGLLGVGALVTGVIIQQPLVGVLGFALMFAGVLIAIAPSKRASAGSPSTGADKRRDDKHVTARFMDNLNERWDKRQDGERR